MALGDKALEQVGDCSLTLKQPVQESADPNRPTQFVLVLQSSGRYVVPTYTCIHVRQGQ